MLIQLVRVVSWVRRGMNVPQHLRIDVQHENGLIETTTTVAVTGGTMTVALAHARDIGDKIAFVLHEPATKLGPLRLATAQRRSCSGVVTRCDATDEAASRFLVEISIEAIGADNQ